MTIEQCREAIEMNDEIRRYKGALEELKDREYVDIEEIPIGYGKETISLAIPASIVVKQTEGIVAELEEKLRKLGVQDEDGN